MPNDIWYGADCAMRVGLMADADTPPTSWYAMEFIQLRATPQKERRDRGKLGAARHNTLDPVKTIPGFQKVDLSLVLDADTRQIPRWLRLLLGAPSTAAADDLYAHTWNSGDETPRYVAIELKTGASEYRVWYGVTLGSFGHSNNGENTRDFNINLGMKALRWGRESAALTGSTTAIPSEATILRALFLVDDVAASNTLQSGWTWDRQLQEDAFLSATPTLAGIRPGGGRHTGSARFRSNAAEFDALSDDDTVFEAKLQMLGVAEDHLIELITMQAMLEAPALEVGGPGILERDVSWVGHQTGSNPASRIVITNDVASYSS